MFAELIIYIALFSSLFSGAFLATFQSIDAMQYLEQKKDITEAKRFMATKLDWYLETSRNWEILSDDTLRFGKNDNQTLKSYSVFLEEGKLIIACLDCLPDYKIQISPDLLAIKSFSAQIFDTPTSTGRILKLSLETDNSTYSFFYYAEK